MLTDIQVFNSTQSSPPALPCDHVYTSCYCEENVYLLAQAFSTRAGLLELSEWDIYVIFVSNEQKTVALWSQRARGDVVVWDYHVVLVLRRRHQQSPEDNLLRDSDSAGSDANPENESNPFHHDFDSAWVYDFDSTLPNPCIWTEYMANTFPYAAGGELALNETYVSCFRVVPASVFLDNFASDRSHMIKQPDAHTSLDGSASPTIKRTYVSPPPSYPPLCGRKARERGDTHNLMYSFVTMRTSIAGADSDTSTSTKAIPRITHEVEEDCHRESQTPPDSEREDEARVAGQDTLTSMTEYGEVMDMNAFLAWLSGT